jgi:nitroreductase
MEKIGVYEAIRSRRSVRSFSKKKIEDKDLVAILEAARFNTSAGGLHLSPKIIIIRNKRMIKLIMNGDGEIVFSSRIRAILEKEPQHLQNADTLLVFCADMEAYLSEYHEAIEGELTSWYKLKKGELYSVQDADLAASNVILQAHALGIGVCWIGQIHEDKLKELLKIKGNVMPVCLLLMGYPDEEGEKAVDKILKERKKQYPCPPDPRNTYFDEEWKNPSKYVEHMHLEKRPRKSG